MVGVENRGCTDDQGREVVVRNDNTPTDISIIYLDSVVRAFTYWQHTHNLQNRLYLLEIFYSPHDFDSILCDRINALVILHLIFTVTSMNVHVCIIETDIIFSPINYSINLQLKYKKFFQDRD